MKSCHRPPSERTRHIKSQHVCLWERMLKIRTYEEAFQKQYVWSFFLSYFFLSYQKNLEYLYRFI